MNRIFVSSFIMIALISALISPACAFNSGGMSLIEICAADGSIQTIALPGDTAPTAPSKHQKTQQECGFCFANTNMKPAIQSDSIIALNIASRYHRISNGQIAPRSLVIKHYEAQGPPVSV